MITRRAIRWALALPLIDGAIYANIRSKLVEAFGGAFEEVIIGARPLTAKLRLSFIKSSSRSRWATA